MVTVFSFPFYLPLILSFIPSSLVFKIRSVLVVFLLIQFGSHYISHLPLRQSQSMIPPLQSLLLPVVYPKVPYMAHSFSLSIYNSSWLGDLKNSVKKYHLYADDTQLRISFTYIKMLLYLLKPLSTLSLTFFP